VTKTPTHEAPLANAGHKAATTVAPATWDPAKVDQMNGLRVYLNPHLQETCGGFGVFYSRRENGPYYRWAYEEKVKLWRVARVQPSDFSLKVLTNANWKGVPAALQKSLVDHYQE
jgi:hypothetical protein